MESCRLSKKIFPHGTDHNLMSPHNLGFGGKEINMISNCYSRNKKEKNEVIAVINFRDIFITILS